MMATPDDVIGPVNLGNPTEFTILALAEAVLRLTGSKSKIVYKPLPQDDPTQRQPDITLAAGLLNWKPGITLEEGLFKDHSLF
jgi:UDP-glucuronate decarboxylase